MSGSVLAQIVIPVVALVALVVFIALVMFADKIPLGGNSGQRSRSAVSGGTFRGDPRQQMPGRDDTPPEVLAPEGQTSGRDRSDA